MTADPYYLFQFAIEIPHGLAHSLTPSVSVMVIAFLNLLDFGLIFILVAAGCFIGVWCVLWRKGGTWRGRMGHWMRGHSL